MIEKGLLIVAGGVFGLTILFSLYAMFFILPISMSAAADCLNRGFPHANVTWTGKAYCIGYKGAVAPMVEQR